MSKRTHDLWGQYSFNRDTQILKKVFAEEKNNLNILFYRILNINMLPLHVRFAKLFINFV